MQPHDLEVRPADHAGSDDSGLTQPDHRELDGGEVAERRLASGCVPGGRVSRAPKSSRFRTRTRRALADVDEAVLFSIDQGPEQHAVDDAEDGRVGANAEREREDDRDGQSLDAAERTKGKSKSVIRLISFLLRARRWSHGEGAFEE